jgi:glucosamine-6-phosphate deaminase
LQLQTVHAALVPFRDDLVADLQAHLADKLEAAREQAQTERKPLPLRLTALMISKKVADPAAPMSLLAEHPNVHFHSFRPAIGKAEVEMH